MTDSISGNLAENALDYLLLASEQAKAENPRMLKHALATLADGVELLLKSRLELKDWCLIFKDVDQATKQKYDSGDFQSVLFEQAVKRLENLCVVSIPDTDLETINELRKLRNRIRHFGLNTSKSVAISLIVKTFSFAIDFADNHLQKLHEPLEVELTQLRTLLGEFEEFVDERMVEIHPLLASAHSVIKCPVCLQEAMALGNGDVVCLFCGHRTDCESAAYQWANRFLGLQPMKDSLIEPRIRACPSCGLEACVDMSAQTDGRSGFVCFNCGEGGYEECLRCGNLCRLEEGETTCQGCYEEFMNSDDDD